MFVSMSFPIGCTIKVLERWFMNHISRDPRPIVGILDAAIYSVNKSHALISMQELKGIIRDSGSMQPVKVRRREPFCDVGRMWMRSMPLSKGQGATRQLCVAWL